MTPKPKKGNRPEKRACVGCGNLVTEYDHGGKGEGCKKACPLRPRRERVIWVVEHEHPTQGWLPCHDAGALTYEAGLVDLMDWREGAEVRYRLVPYVRRGGE